MSHAGLEQLELTFVFLLFDLELLDPVTHGQNLRLKLCNLIHHTSVRCFWLCFHWEIICIWVFVQMSGVERSHGGRHNGQPLLISLLLLLILEKRVIILLCVFYVIKSWLWCLLLSQMLNCALWLYHSLMILSNLLGPERPTLLRKLLLWLLHARLLCHRVHTLSMLGLIVLHSINLTKTLLFTLLFLNLPLNSRNLWLTTSQLLLWCLLLLSLLNIHVIFDLSKLLRGIGVAQDLVKLIKIFLKDIFDTSQLVAIGRPLLRKRRNVLNVTFLPRLWMTAKVERTVLKPLLVCCHLTPMLFLLLLIRLLLRWTFHISFLPFLLISCRVELTRLSLVNIAINLK